MRAQWEDSRKRHAASCTTRTSRIPTQHLCAPLPHSLCGSIWMQKLCFFSCHSVSLVVNCPDEKILRLIIINLVVFAGLMFVLNVLSLLILKAWRRADNAKAAREARQSETQDFENTDTRGPTAGHCPTTRIRNTRIKSSTTGAMRSPYIAHTSVGPRYLLKERDLFRTQGPRCGIRSGLSHPA